MSHHYDLDKRLYQLFLDQDLQYSCAYFESPGMSLEEAQQAKTRYRRQLAIDPDQKVLDIGCGWGGLALYLADICDAEVSGSRFPGDETYFSPRPSPRTASRESARQGVGAAAE